mmetsp:Transcript_5650/g.7460  ORF Transcript_5650/g.7460 Transcript_5650/m.7460 type:complete len:264 (-) Transcript_5650:276-1067(-)
MTSLCMCEWVFFNQTNPVCMSSSLPSARPSALDPSLDLSITNTSALAFVPTIVAVAADGNVPADAFEADIASPEANAAVISSANDCTASLPPITPVVSSFFFSVLSSFFFLVSMFVFDVLDVDSLVEDDDCSFEDCGGGVIVLEDGTVALDDGDGDTIDVDTFNVFKLGLTGIQPARNIKSITLSRFSTSNFTIVPLTPPPPELLLSPPPSLLLFGFLPPSNIPASNDSRINSRLTCKYCCGNRFNDSHKSTSRDDNNSYPLY